MSFVREAIDHPLRFAWDGEERFALVTRFDGQKVDHIDLGNDYGRPSIGRSEATFGAVCDVWLRRQGLSGTTRTPGAMGPPGPAGSRDSGDGAPRDAGRQGSPAATSWPAFAACVRTVDDEHIAHEDQERFVLVNPVPPHRRLHLRHRNIGGMDFVEAVIPVGPAPDLDLYQLFEAVNDASYRLCGLSHFEGRIALKLVVALRGFDLDDWRWPIAAMRQYARELLGDA